MNLDYFLKTREIHLSDHEKKSLNDAINKIVSNSGGYTISDIFFKIGHIFINDNTSKSDKQRTVSLDDIKTLAAYIYDALKNEAIA